MTEIKLDAKSANVEGVIKSTWMGWFNQFYEWDIENGPSAFPKGE